MQWNVILTGLATLFVFSAPVLAQDNSASFLTDGVVSLTPDQRLRAASMVEAVQSCTTDCTLLGVIVKGDALYQKKTTAGESDATLNPSEVSQVFSKLTPDQRLKVRALFEAATTCDADCSRTAIMAKGAELYSQSAAAAAQNTQARVPEDSAQPNTNAAAPSPTKKIRVDYSAYAGGAIRGGTGASVATGGSVALTNGDPLKEAPTYAASADADLGSTSGKSVLPAGRAGVAVSGNANNTWIGKAVDGALKNSDPMGLLELQKRWIVDVNADRDLALKRNGRVSAQAGAEITHGDRNSGTSWTFNPLVEGGVGNIGLRTLPYAMVGAQALAVYCPFMSKSGADEFCGRAGVKVMGGAVQGDLAYEGDVFWQHKISDNPAKAVHSISVEAGVNGEMFIDVVGVQAASNVGLNLIAR